MYHVHCMNKKLLIKIWVCCVSMPCGMLAPGFHAHAQVIMEVMPNARPMDASVVFYGAANFNNAIPYGKIPGSPFLKDEWQLAALYSENDKEKWLVKTKLNLTTGEIYFISKTGEEMVAPENMVRKIVFYKDNDTAQTEAVYRNDYGEGLINSKDKNNYVRVMNEGNYQLLKLPRRPVVEADSFHIAKRYFFRDEIRYFIQYNNKTAPLKKLSADNILVYLPGANSFHAWADQHSINFKKEEDVVRFLDYYNAKK